MSEKLLPCPFCGHDTPEFERMGDRRQSCIVICGNCGARHESSDEGNRCGSSWNQRGDPGQDGLRTSLETALARIEDMLADDDGQAFKEARKFLDANRPLSATPSAPTAVEPDERSPQDFAIEHAEYMAQSAAHLIACVNDLALAEQQCEDGEANPSDVDAARESVTEAQGHLKSSIYEFRKRRDRASKGTP